MSMTDATIAMKLAAIAGVAGAVAFLGGCRGERSDDPPRQFLPDMDDQPKYKAQTKSAFFKDFEDPETGEMYGRSMRQPVAGAVAFGHFAEVGSVDGFDFESGRAEIVKEDPAFYTGKNNDGSWVKFIPARVDEEFLALGRENFGIYCQICHGALGDGMGTVGLRWSYALPTWHQDQYRHGGEKGDDGYIFDVIRHGVPNPGGAYPLKMPSYASKVSERESWAIVAYLRVLQAAHESPVDALPERDRVGLERQLNRGGTPAGGTGEGSGS